MAAAPCRSIGAASAASRSTTAGPNNIFFDTCVYHQPGINLLAEVVPADNILFASEMVGAVKGVDPKTGFNFDDTKRYIDKAPGLSDADRRKIFEGNARRVYSRLKTKAAAKAAV
jgi:4-oxalmesaconate hydratase